MIKPMRYGMAIVSCLVLFAGSALTSNRESDLPKKNLESKKSAVKSSVAPTSPGQKTEVNSQNTQRVAVPASAPAEDLAASPTMPAAAARLTGEQINWFVISSGATNASSTNYQLQGTVGQLAVGPASASSYKVNSGYWQNFVTGQCCQLRGNINATGPIDISDLTFLVTYMFNSGPEPPCLEQANVNAAGPIDIADLTYLVKYMFKGGPTPPPC